MVPLNFLILILVLSYLVTRLQSGAFFNTFFEIRLCGQLSRLFEVQSKRSNKYFLHVEQKFFHWGMVF